MLWISLLDFLIGLRMIGSSEVILCAEDSTYVL